MKLLQFKTVQPKGIFMIPENSFVSYRQSDRSKEERNSGVLTYRAGAKTISTEIEAPSQEEWFYINKK